MRAGDWQGSDRAVAVLVGLGLPQPDMETVEPVQHDIPAGQSHEFAAPESTGEPDQQNRGVAAFEDFVRPAGTAGTRGVDDRHDIGSQQRRPRAAGPVTGGGVVAADPGHRGAHQIVCRGTGVPGLAVVVGDRRHMMRQRRRGICSPAVGGEGVGGRDQVGGDGDRVRRQDGMPLGPAPGGEFPPGGGVGAASACRPRRRHSRGDTHRGAFLDLRYRRSRGRWDCCGGVKRTM